MLHNTTQMNTTQKSGALHIELIGDEIFSVRGRQQEIERKRHLEGKQE